MEKYYNKYILSLLEWQETKLKCINMGCTSNKEILNEIEVIRESKVYFKELTKENKDGRRNNRKIRKDI